ncbi:MAG TPA: ribosome maturation factor RimM [Oscillatoriaceae cyanobacterium]
MTQAPQYLNVAQIVTPFGVQGELKVRPETDDPLRLKELKVVSCLLATGERIELHPEIVKLRKDGVLVVKFKEFDAPEPAAKLRRAWLQVPLSEAKREPGKVLYADVLGLIARDDATNAPLGTVREVLRAAQDLLEIETPDGKEVLVPWVDVFVKKVDLEGREIRLTPPEGLFE